MEFKISELMNDYIDHAYSPAEDHETSVERIKAMTMEKINRGQKKPVRKLGRTLLIAAVLAAVLAVAAFAVYQATMADRVVADWTDTAEGTEIQYTQYSPVGAVETETGSGVETGAIGPEAQAFAEWTEYLRNRSEDEMGELVPYEDPVRSVYGNAWSNDVAKLKEIAEKYGLRLYKSVENVSTLDAFYEAAGLEAFAPFSEGSAETAGCSADVYDDGSFMLSAVSVPLSGETEDSVVLLLYRSMKGAFCDFYIVGDEAESYVTEDYMTDAGIPVEVSLGERYSQIYAELENCYVTIDVNGGTNPGEYLTLLDMDDLKYIADGIDFAVLGR